jgi:predicted Zn-dependent protease
MASFPARHFAGSADGTPVDVRVTAHGLEFESRGNPTFWRFADLRMERRPRRGEPFVVEHQEPGAAMHALYFDTPAVLEAVRASTPDAAHLRKSSGPSVATTLIAIAVAVVLLTVLTLWLGVPALAGWLAHHTPPEWEQRYGELVMEQVAAGAKPIEEPSVTQPIRRMVDRLEAAGSKAPFPFQVRVLDRDDVNALAGPGGHIVVFRGMIEHTKSPDELAAVLAHEMEHATRRHVTRAMYRGLSLGVLVSILAGDAGGSAVPSMARSLGELSFGRADELEADAGAFTRLAGAGIDPGAMARALDGLAAKGGQPKWADFLSTHPAPAERARRLRAMPAPEVRAGRVLVNEVEWSGMKAALAARPRAASTTH